MLNYCCLLLLLSFTLFGAIVCPSGVQFISRRDRSTFNYEKPIINRVLGILPNEFQLRKPAAAIAPVSQQQQQSNAEPWHGKSKANLSETINRIFRIGNDSGIHLFNTAPYNPFAPYSSTHHQHSMRADETFIVQKTQKEPFKVQRSPDGKLNLVFNDSPFLQPVATGQSNDTQRKPRPDIIFPDQHHNALSDINAECDELDSVGKTLCKNVHNYPNQTVLDQLLQADYTKFKLFFGEDVLEPRNISQRIGDDDIEGQDFCQSTSEITYPKSGKTKDATWKFIVNTVDVKQGIRIELCRALDKPCQFAEHLPNGYECFCKQHFSFRDLVVISNDTKSFEKDSIRLPSCCKCAYRPKRK